MQSLLIIIAICPVSRWHLLRLCMEGSAEHRCLGTRLEKVGSLDREGSDGD
jgi:hypothetical protein